MIDLGFQPKQQRALDIALDGPASVIGVGGGRGAAKSRLAHQVAITLMIEWPGCSGCIAMRNYDQVRKYHIEPMIRDFPVLDDYYARANAHIKLPVGNATSQLDFSYAESMPDVERRFRSGNYWFIIVDQAEQFTGAEIREMRKACRRKGGGRAVLILLFNMGGAGIQDLRKWFYTKEYNEGEDPNDYAFIHVFPWDNVEWVRAALTEDGLSPRDYYAWTDAQRKEYAATRGEYTRQLASDDPAIRARDWESSWESLEGAYFGRVFDRQSTMIGPDTVASIQKPWDKRWISQDWGKGHFCPTQWHSMSTLSPHDAKLILGWETNRPLRVIITYRERIVSEQTSTQVGQMIVRETPVDERALIKAAYLSPDAFGERDSPMTIADNQNAELRRGGMALWQPADTERPGGWGLMHSLLWNTKSHGQTGDTVWLISVECSELLSAIPVLMRDPKNIDVVLKTDMGQAKIEQDVSECARYGLKSQLGTVAKPFAVVVQEAVQAVFDSTAGDDSNKMTAANMMYLKMQADRKKKPRFSRQY